MINILFSGNNLDFDGVLTSTLSILTRSEYKGPYTFYIYEESGNNVINDQMLDYLNDIVIGFHYQSKVVKVSSAEESTMSAKMTSFKSHSLVNEDLNKMDDNVVNDYEYVISQNKNCAFDDVLAECRILKEIFQSGAYYA